MSSSWLTIKTISTIIIDEIIRQVTINCTERGLLLLRVRDEINMRDEAYERQVMRLSVEICLFDQSNADSTN